MADEVIHFFTGDERACNYEQTCGEALRQGMIEPIKTRVTRRVTVIDSQVTCPDCLENEKAEWPEVFYDR